MKTAYLLLLTAFGIWTAIPEAISETSRENTQLTDEEAKEVEVVDKLIEEYVSTAQPPARQNLCSDSYCFCDCQIISLGNGSWAPKVYTDDQCKYSAFYFVSRNPNSEACAQPQRGADGQVDMSCPIFGGQSQGYVRVVKDKRPRELLTSDNRGGLYDCVTLGSLPRPPTPFNVQLSGCARSF